MTRKLSLIEVRTELGPALVLVRSAVAEHRDELLEDGLIAERVRMRKHVEADVVIGA
jgi:hypothetical protein